jgi:cytochrome c553
MMRTLAAALCMLWAGAAAAQNAAAPTYAQRFAALCAACHGANGVSTLADTPSLAGQHMFYAATQLYLFRAGRRSNPAMTEVAKGLSDDDLRGFADYIGQLPPADSPMPAPPADPARMAQAQALGQRHQCASCHASSYAGGQQVPRVAGQREDYLQRALREYKDGTRVGYTSAMNEAVARVPQADLDLMAWYLARLPATGAR